MLHVLPPNVTTAVDLREHLHRAHLERLARMNAKALNRRRAAGVVSRAQIISRMVYAAPIGPVLPPPDWAGIARLIYLFPIGPRDILDVSSKAEPRMTAAAIIRDTCTKYGVSKVDLIGQRRHVSLMVPRFEACWRMKNETTLSYPQIGKMMGGRDHTSILNAVRKHQKRIDEARHG